MKRFSEKDEQARKGMWTKDGLLGSFLGWLRARNRRARETEGGTQERSALAREMNEGNLRTSFFLHQRGCAVCLMGEAVGALV